MSKILQILGKLPSGEIDYEDLEKAVEDYLTENPPASGKDGKSPYQYALDGGYEGTEEDFMESFIQIVSTGHGITKDNITNGGSENGTDN